MGDTRAALSAGIVPKSSVVIAVTPAVNASTTPSIETSRNTVLTGVESCRTSSALALEATTRPAAAPTADNSRLSMRSWRATLHRDAPSATCTLSSWRRATARASSRLARLTQPMSITAATMAAMISIGRW